MIWIDVDTAVKLFANSDPMMASADGTTIDETIAYNESGMELIMHFTTCAGVTSSTVITPTTGDDHDWLHSDGGIYTVEVPASGGDFDNDTEGFGFLTGKADAVLPWTSRTYGFRKASMNNVMVENGTLQDNLEDMYDGTGYAMGTIKPQTDLTQILAHTLTDTGTQLADGFQKFFDVGTPTGTVNSLPGAAPDAAGGLMISDDGGWDADELYDAIVTDAAGANIAVDIIAVKAETADILTDTGTTLPAEHAALPTAAENRAEMDSNSTELAAILTDTGTTLPAEHAALPTAVENRQEMDSNSTQLSAIVTDTAEIGAAGAGLTAIWDIASALTLDFGTLVERIYQLLNNPMKITNATGAVALRNAVDGADIATGSITDADPTTIREAYSWV